MGNGGNRYWDGSGRHAYDSWWGGPLHAVILLLFLALLVAGAVWLGRRFLRGGLAPVVAGPQLTPAAAFASDPAVAALRLRYASGGVSRDEFQRAMRDLTGDGAVQPGEDPEATAS